jgi:hypothetical protein
MKYMGSCPLNRKNSRSNLYRKMSGWSPLKLSLLELYGRIFGELATVSSILYLLPRLQASLTAMHNLFLKEHNRIAGVLFEELSRRSRLSPSKLDELVFQEI